MEPVPSRPSLQAWAMTVGPSPSICSLNRMPGSALASTRASVALRTSSGSRHKSSPFNSIRSKAYRNTLQCCSRIQACHSRFKHHENRHREVPVSLSAIHALCRSAAEKSSCLFCPLPYQLSFPATRGSHVGLLHFVARDRHGSLLTGPVPIRKRAAFNVKVKGMIRPCRPCSRFLHGAACGHLEDLIRFLVPCTEGNFGRKRCPPLPESHTKSFLYVPTERAPIPTPS